MSVLIPNGQFYEGHYIAGPKLFSSGGNLYFVTLNIVGSPLYVGADYGLAIYKSTDGGNTWTKPVSDYDRGTTNSAGIAVIQTGTVLNIAVPRPNGNAYANFWYLFRFDMSGDTFLADKTGPLAGPVELGQIVAFNDNHLLLTASSGYAIFDGTSFTTASSYAALPDTSTAEPAAAVHDPVTDKAFIFFMNGTFADVYCATIDESLTESSYTHVINTTLPGGFNSGIDVGWPAVFGSQLNISFRESYSNIKVARSPVSALSFTVESIDTSAIVGAGNEPATLDIWYWSVPYTITVGGTLAVIFAVQNDFNHGTQYNSSARGWLYESHTTSDTGGWTAPALIFSGPAPSSMGSAYPLALTSSSGGLVTATFDPVEFIGSGTKYHSFDLWYVPFSFTPPPTVTCGTLADGTVGTPYTGTLAVSGGTPPYTFALTAGSLPPGLALNTSSGVISGTPTTAGTYGFTVQVTDADAQTGSVICSITIHPPPVPTLTCGTLADGTLGTPYSQSLSISGGTPPYTLAQIGGTLPPGLTLNTSTGVISGTPTLGGAFSFTVKVTDALAQTATVTCTINIVEPGGPIAIVCGPLSSATPQVGVPFNSGVGATGATPPYAFALTAGSLPAGLSLDPVTGIIHGTPTTNGSSTFTVQVMDTFGQTASVSCSLTVTTPGGGGGGGTSGCQPGFTLMKIVVSMRENKRLPVRGST